jgi:hypothetical protein
MIHPYGKTGDHSLSLSKAKLNLISLSKRRVSYCSESSKSLTIILNNSKFSMGIKKWYKKREISK